MKRERETNDLIIFESSELFYGNSALDATLGVQVNLN